MEFSFVDIGNQRLSCDRDPNLCPICHHKINPVEQTWALTDWYVTNEPILERVFKCPNRECGHLFIAQYQVGEMELDDRSKELAKAFPISRKEFKLKNLFPKTPKPALFPDEISNISPMFVLIFNQANESESYDLSQIAGMGYRKALEFLIKDYCIYINPDKGPEIKTKFLSVCISEFVDDEKIKQCAKRATWLGNDETHYLRKWQDKDIEDLKILIKLTVNWIENVLLTKKYSEDMP